MIVISSTNNRTTPIGANLFFVGGGEDVSQFSTIRIVVRGTPAAPGTIFVDFSSDGVIYFQAKSFPVTNPATFVPVTVKVTNTYFRVRYGNGATPQTTFRLQCEFFGDLLVGAGVASGSANVNFVKHVVTLDSSQAAAKSVALPSVPLDASAVVLEPYGGPRQRFGVDFTVSSTTVSWSGLGLDGFLDAGDVVELTYFT